MSCCRGSMSMSGVTCEESILLAREQIIGSDLLKKQNAILKFRDVYRSHFMDVFQTLILMTDVQISLVDYLLHTLVNDECHLFITITDNESPDNVRDVLRSFFLRNPSISDRLLPINTDEQTYYRNVLKPKFNLMDVFKYNPLKFEEVKRSIRNAVLLLVLWVIDNWNSSESPWMKMGNLTLSNEMLTPKDYRDRLLDLFSKQYNKFRNTLDKKTIEEIESRAWYINHISITLHSTPSAEMTADLLTKAVPKVSI